ncbi:hypothetical protein PTSG_00913 [Salpingoeca rosetta]|uniref:Translation initiation factor eIF2B subunit alpha n=1 Tax=Salpingoeca rosetta (strain ATCC 50818 / BSB-021) TaxID=946362 RepID=F2TXU9_SALR5|nr:uncharacterized protein PTSG_00913 [Salpingoeca rosetta]EGD76208.1 hypothetical protein PTSG_00913 [Salpingoeca rosetta]|eukprot:XP_004998383.1 hypothetical protein PTSG_00913 [Salpingoeca rosetta]
MLLLALAVRVGVAELVACFKKQRELNPEESPAIAATQALLEMIRKDDEQTVAGFRENLQNAKKILVETADTTITCVSSACDLFVRHVTLQIADADDWKQMIIQQGELFVERAHKMRSKLMEMAGPFIRDGVTVLTLGRSRVVESILIQAANQKKRFQVYAVESIPSKLGVSMATALSEHNIDVTLIPDAAVAYVMSRVDVVLTGAEAVVENGGIINTIGTYQAAMAAHALKKPFYAASESFKFIRLFPLSQADVGTKRTAPLLEEEGAVPFKTESPAYDFTPPEYITLLFTDIGILTPAAVSDALMNLTFDLDQPCG